MTTEYSFPSDDELVAAGYCVFPKEMEDDPLVLFHAAPADKVDKIRKEGFKSAEELGTGILKSVSFAYRSMSALTHLASFHGPDNPYVMFAVRYENLDQKGIIKNVSDIHDYSRDPPPEIIGICRIPPDYEHK